MTRTETFKQLAKPNDIIVCRHIVLGGVREVRVTENLGVECEGQTFKWDYWFEVNQPIMFRTPNGKPVTEMSETQINFALNAVEPNRNFKTSKDLVRRKKAMGWWRGLSVAEQMELANNYYSRDDTNNLTGREIEKIYKEKFGE